MFEKNAKPIQIHCGQNKLSNCLYKCESDFLSLGILNDCFFFFLVSENVWPNTKQKQFAILNGYLNERDQFDSASIHFK